MEVLQSAYSIIISHLMPLISTILMLVATTFSSLKVTSSLEILLVYCGVKSTLGLDLVQDPLIQPRPKPKAIREIKPGKPEEQSTFISKPYGEEAH